MSKITKISPWIPKGQSEVARYYIDIDGKTIKNKEGKSFSIRAKTFPALGLFEGMEITVDELIAREVYFFKNAYGESGFLKEKIRLDHVEEFLRQVDPEIKLERTGFGADSTEIYYEHPEESGTPDFSIKNDDDVVVMHIEVSGTEVMRGQDYWVRPDKMTYVQKHLEVPIWIILHFQKPVETLVFIKPDPQKNYDAIKEVKEIQGAREEYVCLSASSIEVCSESEFVQELKLYLQ